MYYGIFRLQLINNKFIHLLYLQIKTSSNNSTHTFLIFVFNTFYIPLKLKNSLFSTQFEYQTNCFPSYDKANILFTYLTI